ncbi:urease accessory protein UreD [Streptomyces sp. RB6PN25]|uniref:Urease accessory protein UreD n=1 Tax=Streptomyces humicola TaxID=2953240 RepID=A0ABT1PQC6_9ACTN|nr:urease accessory protein UreD [Streptomyces humicola]MCQ4079873.1 urease accessory protein UreD [Streptomyces humicola]
MTTALAGSVPRAGVRATARIVAVADGRGGTALPVLAGEGPLALRRTRASGPDTHVTVVGAMSAPLGGDRIVVEVTVGAEARLTVGASAATVSLPGRTGGRASYDLRLTVGEGAELHWLPEPVIAAAGSDLIMTTRVELAPGARLVLREEQVLGRAREETGRLVSRLLVRHDGRPLLDQELAFGPDVPGWAGPAVLGEYHAAGQLLVAGLGFDDTSPEPRLLGDTSGDGDAVLAPLAGPAVLATAIAPDALRVRQLLDRAVTCVAAHRG